MKEPTTPEIEMISLKSLHLRKGFNPRTDANTKANVKDLLALFKVRGGYDPTQPIRYVEEDGQNIALDHSRYIAAQEFGCKTVAAMKVTLNRQEQEIYMVTGNSARPHTPFETGESCVRLRDGIPAPDSTEEKPTWLVAPMSIAEIATAIGKSSSTVMNCIAVRENSPEVAELIVGGKVSASAVIFAKRALASRPEGKPKKGEEIKVDDGKLFSLLKKAMGAADGAKVTEKHIKSVLPQPAPKKQVAVFKDQEDGKDKTPFSRLADAIIHPGHEKVAGSLDDLGKRGETEKAPELDLGSGNSQEPANGASNTPQEAPKASRSVKTAGNEPEAVTERKSALFNLIDKWGDECMIAGTNGDYELLVERVEAFYGPKLTEAAV